MIDKDWYYENQTPNLRIGFKIKNVIFSGKSKYQKIDIYQTEAFGKLFTLDDIVMLTERDEFVYHEMIANVPLCTHKAPENVLVIGGGDGGTIREVVKHKVVKKVVLCEIDDVVIDKSKEYLPFTASEFDNPKTEVVIEDGFKYLKEKQNEFDVILVDSTDPIGEGEKLFGEDFYKLCYSSLKEDGILVFQSESPYTHPKFISENINKRIKKIFEVCSLYLVYIPFYPSGMWSFGFASKKYHPINDFVKSRAEDISKQTKYYNPEVHKSCFSLPNFVKEIV